MQAIRMFKADDGKLFESRELALDHEDQIHRKERLDQALDELSQRLEADYSPNVVTGRWDSVLRGIALNPVPARDALNAFIQKKTRIERTPAPAAVQIDPSKLDKPLAVAMEFLTGALSGGPVPSKEVEATAKELGIALGTLERARLHLSVKTYRRGYGPAGRGYWELPSQEAAA